MEVAFEDRPKGFYYLKFPNSETGQDNLLAEAREQMQFFTILMIDSDDGSNPLPLKHIVWTTSFHFGVTRDSYGFFVYKSRPADTFCTVGPVIDGAPNDPLVAKAIAATNSRTANHVVNNLPFFPAVVARKDWSALDAAPQPPQWGAFP